MSIGFNQHNDFPPVLRRALGRLFGSCIEKIREGGGRSAEQASRLAGMELPEWAAIEAGHVPESAPQMRSLAGALEVGQDQIALLAPVCGDAW